MSITNTLRLDGDSFQSFVPSLPVSSAVLCVDCECITVSYHEGCPICGGRSLLNIAQILGGTLGGDRVRTVEAQLEIVRCA